MDLEFRLERFLKSPFVFAIVALFGILLLILALAFLYWSEGKAVSTAISLEQGAASARTIDAGRVDSANEGQLVHVTDTADTDRTLTDPDFGITVKALRLTREVEVYQWKETKTEKKKGDVTEVNYDYGKVWSKDKPGKSFHQPAGHDNPADKPYADAKLKADHVTLGAFTLSAAQVEKVPAGDSLSVAADMLSSLADDLKKRATPDDEGRLFIAADAGHGPDTPKVGDARIRYSIAGPQTVTVLAKQTQSTFEPYVPEGGEKIDLVKPGTHSAEAMIESAHSSNRSTNWILRGTSYFLLSVGLFLVIHRQIRAATGTTPSGIFANLGLGLFALFVALPFVLIVIGVRRLGYQQTLGVTLLAAGSALLAGLLILSFTSRSGLFANLRGRGKA
jgi:hypothetical protein